MDFYADAVAILEAIVRGLHGQDFFGWLRFEERKKQFLEKKNGVALLPVKNRYLWPAIEPVSYTYLGMKQLMAGGGVVLIGTQLIPLLGGLF